MTFRHISITRSEFVISKDGMKLFSLIHLNADYERVQFAIGLRNPNDKSMQLGTVAGYRVFICDNMALSGNFKPLLAKHSKNFDLVVPFNGWTGFKEVSGPYPKRFDFKRQYQPISVTVCSKKPKEFLGW